jgi:hypothetical protein
MLDIGVILRDLALKRPVFHSEADFQHAVAWEVHSRWPELSVRLEFRPPHMDNRTYVDIWCNAGSRAVVLELKYKTRKLDVNVAGEAFDLLDQSAHDIGRYDFLKDVMRLERIVADRTGLAGYAIFLTNDSAYWRKTVHDQTADAGFRMHESRRVTGILPWGSGASAGTMRGREQQLKISGEYTLIWQDYSEPTEERYGKFRYLLVTVHPRRAES